ncbi:MAG: T9SS type A sorting domain-containing protein [Flavobacteriales bacterium]|nr:T9SS type A sorting domain-containing protein [Flavobacteriales bacterium]
MKRIAAIATLLFFTSGLSGQISHGGDPVTSSGSLSTSIPVVSTPKVDAHFLRSEDAVTDLHKDIPPRFGVVQTVSINLQNAGSWENLPNGDKVWRLEIHAPDAISINLNFSGFYLPQGSTFFVFNQFQTQGAFNYTNNKTTGEFSTAPIRGDRAILEYYEPAGVQGQGIIELESVVHGYRDFWKQLKAFGSSGSCNVNAICDTTYWGNEIRSGVMLLTASNSRFCSGALIANVPQDGTPFVLTANHCTPSSNNIFMFNYQSPGCTTTTDGPLTQTISGCTLRATDTPSDFYLVELSSIPPAGYNVFYSGWSNVDVAPTKGTGIHHPVGDVKKISHDNDLLVSAGYYSAGNDHWQVVDWNSGTTQGGSSGSPLYDQNHRIVGQLHGGDAACGNDAFDYYGKFSVSWDNSANTAQQLKFWLDPGNTGANYSNGYDPNGSAFSLDAVLIDVSGINRFICGDTIRPKITFRNHGSTSLTSLKINYQLDGGGISTVNWNGNLSTYDVDSIMLPAIYVASGDHIFSTSCSDPNSSTDQNALNDTASVAFRSNADPTIAALYLHTDNFGAETSWIVRDASGKIYTQSTGYQSVNGGEQITEYLCLYDSCFTLVIKDEYGDGFCCTFGNGSAYLTDNFGDTIFSNTTFNSDSLVIPFCIAKNSIDEYSLDEFNLFPNPSNGLINVKTNNASDYQLTVFDAMGRTVYHEPNMNSGTANIDLSHCRKGIYLVQVLGESGRQVRRLVLH